MAKDQKQPEPVIEADASAEALGPPKSYRLQIALGFAALILFEMIVLWMLLPSRTQVPVDIGVDPVTGVAGYEGPNVLPPDIGIEDPTEERPLKETAFKVKSVRNDANETFSVVLHVKIRKADAKKFDKRYAQCTQEIIDRVTTTLNASSDDDRREVTYTAIKEKVKRAINEVLGVPWVQDVLVSEPSFDVQ